MGHTLHGEGESSCLKFCLWANHPVHNSSRFLFSFPGEGNSAPKVCRPSLLTFRLQRSSVVNNEQLSSPLGVGEPGWGAGGIDARYPAEQECTGERTSRENLRGKRASFWELWGLVGLAHRLCTQNTASWFPEATTVQDSAQAPLSRCFG